MNGLVLALDAGNIKSYPGSGTNWTDLIGSGNSGTLGGTSNDYGNDIAVDGSGNVYVIGFTASTSNVLIAKLPADGAFTGNYGAYTYATSSLTAATSSLTDTTSTFTSATPTLTSATSSLTDTTSTFTSSVIVIP